MSRFTSEEFALAMHAYRAFQSVIDAAVKERTRALERDVDAIACRADMLEEDLRRAETLQTELDHLR